MRRIWPKVGLAVGVALTTVLAVVVAVGADSTATKTYVSRTGTAATFNVAGTTVGTSATSLGTLDTVGYDTVYVMICNDGAVDLTNLTLLVRYNATDSGVTFYDSTDWATACAAIPFISSNLSTLGAGTCGAFHADALGAAIELKATVGASTASVRWSGVLAGG